MFDMGLHFRFLQKATEALFEMGQASVAATLAVQSRIHEDITSVSISPPEPHTWPLLTGLQPGASYFGSAAWPTDTSAGAPWQAWFESWMQFAPVMAQHSYGVTSAPPAWAFSWNVPGWPLAPVSPWTFYQGPMVACMLSYGVPYAVAAPTARASTSAMDAADAACTQFRLMFGNDNERSTAQTIRRATRR